MGPDINHLAKVCHTCEWNKVHGMSKLLYVRYAPPTDRFTNIAIDLMGRLPMSKGFNHIKIIVDRSFRYFEAVLIITSSAEEIIRGLMEGFIQRFGVPERVVSDNALCFRNQAYQKFEEVYSLPYMPRTNSYSEGLVKQIKRALGTHDERHSWVDILPLVTLSLSAILHTTARASPAQAAFTLT